MRIFPTIVFIILPLLGTVAPTASADRPSDLKPRAQGWLVAGFGELSISAPAAAAPADLDELKAIVAGRTPADVEKIRWWNVGGPVYRWNEIAVEAMMDAFVTMPLAARHLALVHAAMDDAVMEAWHHRKSYNRLPPSKIDPSIVSVLPAAPASTFPSDFAAAAAAAAEVLGYLFPLRAGEFSTRAEEAMRARVLSGAEFPADVAAGRDIGQRISALAITRGKADRSDSPWNGTLQAGAGTWQGANPIAPMAATWQTWVLERPNELRPPPPPAFDSEQVRLELAELKAFKRTPKFNHRAVYWEVFGGARLYALWNDLARTKLLEYSDRFDPPTAARALATLNVAVLDAGVACWDAKYAYWSIRPSQLDPEVKPLFPPPNHPSYPAAHGCLSTAAATVLAHLFPTDAESLLAAGREAAEARLWAGVHYRVDIEVGQELGRTVGKMALARAFMEGKR
jgi:membrane-associated phospholipid phosphatase